MTKSIQQDMLSPISKEELKEIKKWEKIQIRLDSFRKKTLNEDKDTFRQMRLNSEVKKVLIEDAFHFLEDLPYKYISSESFLRSIFLTKAKLLPNKRLIKIIPNSLMNNEDFIASIASVAPDVLRILPVDIKLKRQIFIKCLESDGETIQHIPGYSITKEMALIAVKNTYKAYQHLDKYLCKDEDICLQVVEKSPKMYQKIYFNFQNDFTFCKRALSRNIKVWFHLNSILKNDKYIIEHVLRRFKDLESVGLYEKNLEDNLEFCSMPFLFSSRKKYTLDEIDFLKNLMASYCSVKTKKALIEKLKALPDSSLNGNFEKYF